MPDLSWVDVLARIALAGALGGAIGLERELRERAAGLRTHLLQGRRRIAIELELAQRTNPSAVVARLMEQEGVLAAEWSE